MKEYITLSRELFNIKKAVLSLLLTANKENTALHRSIILETGRQLRFDLEQLKAERFLNIEISVGDQRLIRKINNNIMVKFAVIRRRFDRENKMGQVVISHHVPKYVPVGILGHGAVA